MNLDRPLAPDPYEFLPDTDPLHVASEDFADGGPLPESAGAAGGNTSPQLSWGGAPGTVAAYLVTCYDPDAPVASGFRHWAVLLPGSTTSLPAGAGGGEDGALPEGAVTLRNDNGNHEFGGAAPPEGDRAHRYIFAVTALDTADLGLDADTSFAKAQFATLGNVMARGTLTGTFQL